MLERLSPYWRAAGLAHLPVRLAAGFRPHLAVVPDTSAAKVAAKATHEARISVPTGAHLWALSGTSAEADGYSVQITDIGTKKPLLSQPAHFANVTGQGSVTVLDCRGGAHSVATPLHLLPKPLAILEPGQVAVQLTNLAAVENKLQLCLHFTVPRTRERNAYNAVLDEEFAIARRAIREAAGERSKLEPVMNHVPFSIAAVGDNVVVAGSAGAKITIYELDLWNVVQQTITLLDGPDRLRGPLTDFPGLFGRTWDDNGKPHFQLTAGRSFILNLQNGTEVSGYVRYRME